MIQYIVGSIVGIGIGFLAGTVYCAHMQLRRDLAHAEKWDREHQEQP
jgi:hypothetical protein